MIELGRVHEIAHYPVKSMAGTTLDSAFLGWHGLAGDRRFAFRRAGDDSGFPWLSASRIPELILYRPCGVDESSGEPVPTHVRTPGGSEVALRSAELTDEIAARFGSAVELMKLKHGTFDEAPLSVITLVTMNAIGRDAGVETDSRRFRPNIVLDAPEAGPFAEDGWIGGTIVFGDGAAVSVTLPDERCMMINLDPDTAVQNPRMLKSAVRLNRTNAGVYTTVVHTGTIRVGDRVTLVPAARS